MPTKFCCDKCNWPCEEVGPVVIERGVGLGLDRLRCTSCVLRSIRSVGAMHDALMLCHDDDVTESLERNEQEAKDIMRGLANGIALGIGCWALIAIIVWAVWYLPVEVF